MDWFQFFLGIAFTFFGGAVSFRSRDIKRSLLGFLLLIIGIALLVGGFGGRI